jgi:hypothetical protein
VAYAILMGVTCQRSWMKPTHGCVGLLTIEPPKQGSYRGNSYRWLMS